MITTMTTELLGEMRLEQKARKEHEETLLNLLEKTCGNVENSIRNSIL